jgi:hypothetical protein
MYCNTASGFGLAQLNYGTGTPPLAGAAAIGTLMSNQAFSANVGQPANAYTMFSLNGMILSGLVKGTAYWFDVFYCAGNAAWAAGMAGLCLDVFEL